MSNTNKVLLESEIERLEYRISKSVFKNEIEKKLEGKLKNESVFYFLTLFLGWTGLHWFYIGKPLKGMAYLLTFGFLGLGIAADLYKSELTIFEYNIKVTREVYNSYEN